MSRLLRLRLLLRRRPGVSLDIGDGVGDHLLRHEQADVLGAPVDDVGAEGENVLVRDLELLLLCVIICCGGVAFFVF